MLRASSHDPCTPPCGGEGGTMKAYRFLAFMIAVLVVVQAGAIA